MSIRSFSGILLMIAIVVSLFSIAGLTTPASAVKYGGTLKVALPSEPNTFNWFAAGSSWSLYCLYPVYDRLFRWKNGTLVPELVKEWSVSEDGLEYTFVIYDNVTFHDGTPLTAEDVAFTINVLAQYDWPYYHGYFTFVDHAEAVDKYTVKVYMKDVDVDFVATSLSVMNVMPKHIWEPIIKEKGDEAAVYNPKIPDEVIGSGPFKLVEYVPGQYVKYVAYENYWLGRPYLDELIITFITESSTAILAVQKGDIDLYVGWVTPEVVPQLLSTPGVAVHLYQSYTFYHWGMNNLRWPFNITEFRKAMAYCVDKEYIVNEILMGYGVPGSWGVAPPFGVWEYWYNPNVEGWYTFNLTKAAEILDKLGFIDVDGDGWREAPNGTDFSFEIYPPHYDIIRIRAAQKIAEWLSQIPGGGIKAEVRIIEWKSLWPLIRDGKIDTYLLGSGPGLTPKGLYRRFHSWPGGTGNWARFSNATADELLELQLKTLDKEKRRELVWKVQEIIADQVPIIVLYYRKFPQPYRTDKFEGWFKPVDGGLFNIWTLRQLHLKGPETVVVTTVVPTTVVQTQTVVQTKTLTTSVVQTRTMVTTISGTPTTIVTTTTVPTVITTTVPTTVVTTVTTATATPTTAPAGPDMTTIAALIVVILVIIVAALLLRRR